MVRSYSVEEPEVPSMGQVVNRQRVGLSRQGENGLNGNVHDHHTLGAQAERQDFEGIGDKETRETNGIEDTKDPDKDNLADTVTLHPTGRFISAGQGCPNGEGNNHT